MNKNFVRNLNIIVFLAGVFSFFFARAITPILLIVISFFNVIVLLKSGKERFIKKIILSFNMAYISWAFANILTYKDILMTDQVLRHNWILAGLFLIPMIFLFISTSRLLIRSIDENYKFSIVFDAISWFLVFGSILLPLLSFINVTLALTSFEKIVFYFYIAFVNYYVSISIVYFLKIRKYYLYEDKYSNILVASLFLVLGNIVCVARIIFSFKIYLFEFILYFIYVILYFYSVNSFMWNDRPRILNDEPIKKFWIINHVKIALVPLIFIFVLYYFGYIYLYSLIFAVVILFVDLNVNLYVYSERSKDSYVKKISVINDALDKIIKNQTTDMLETKRKLLNKINIDYLTGLYSVEYFYHWFDKLAEKEEPRFSIVFLNIDDFRNINNVYTYIVGDKLLIEIAKRLKENFDEDYILFRFLGDEFAVVFNGICTNNIKMVADKVNEIFAEPFSVEGHNFLITVSISAVRCPVDSFNPKELIQLGTVAMYYSKKNGVSGNITFYSYDILSMIHKKSEIETVLRQEKLKDILDIKPRYRLDKNFNRVEGVSVGLVTKHDKLIDTSISEILEVSRQLALESEIAEFYLELIKELLGEISSEYEIENLCIDIEFKSVEYIYILKEMLEFISRAEYSNIGLEFYLGSDLLKDLHDDYFHIFSYMKDNDIRVSIKNFGIGFTSFHIINKCGVTGFIVSKQLIDDVDLKSDDYSVVSSIVNIAKTLGVYVLAVGVRRISQVKALSELGVDYYQGTYITREVNSMKKVES